MQPFPHPSDATHKIWSRLANWLQWYSSLKVWTTTDDRQRTDYGQLVYYKLTLWAFGSGELIKGQRLEEVENFKYLGAIISNEGSKPWDSFQDSPDNSSFFYRCFSRLKIMWRDKNISLASKFKLMRTLILFTFLFMLVRAGPWQQKSREGSKLLRWDAIGDFWIFST